LRHEIECDCLAFVVLRLEEEKDIERLRSIALLYESQMKHVLAQLASKCAELDALKGTDGESLQQALKLIEKADAVAAGVADETKSTSHGRPRDFSPAKEQREQTGHGPTEQPALPRVDREYELGQSQGLCASCGNAVKEMTGQAECSEMIDLIDIKYQVVNVRRKKYVCNCGAHVVTAPGPQRAVEGGRYSLAFGVKIAFDKYVSHLPLERQARTMGYHSLRITSQTLWDQCQAIEPLFAATYDAIKKQVLRQPVIGLDQTSWPDLENKSLPPWQMWCLTAPGLVYHDIRDDKSANTFTSIVGNYRGTIICDDLSTHRKAARGSPDITFAGCWAHIYRRFSEASAAHGDAKIMLAWIGDLYALDATASSIEERGRARREHAPAILQKMRDWMHAQRVPRTTTLGAAILHTLTPHNWSKLTVFVNNPLVPLDNNATERALRGPVIGRRNHFGSKSFNGTKVAAVMYSLVESAKVANVDPMAYLNAVANLGRQQPGATLLPADFQP
jgi:transposase